ncbi:hypothetical protein BDN70DRAFT_880209 [Pholiota conissans]|uniref:C2H2-type domain-containing protein n=1 Tax=Pholiota conissans TaxID=109636 RepID=A0A9P5YZA5_9AGAR|nr:hypothetical protein BDN70DRAFT_880209 [Pholiota conissans]
MASSARLQYKSFPPSSMAQLQAPCADCSTSTRGHAGAPDGSFNDVTMDRHTVNVHHAPGDQLTAQCTDQCVVIACSNPNHPESICARTGPHTQCDFVCDEGVDCADCHGFDAFLQCCDDYHPYGNGAKTPPATTSSAWEVAFAQWCAECSEPVPPLVSVASAPARDTGKTIDGSGAQLSSSKSYQQQLHHHHQQSMSSSGSAEDHLSTRSPTPSAASPPHAFTCMWAACNASFNSLSELVGHVNLDHLAHSSAASSTPSSSSLGTPSGSFTNTLQSDGNNTHRNEISPISCLWDNCDSSYFASSDNSFELLANHLFSEHLHLDADLGMGSLTAPQAQNMYEQQFQRELERQQSQSQSQSQSQAQPQRLQHGQQQHLQQQQHQHTHHPNSNHHHHSHPHQHQQQHDLGNRYEAQMHAQVQQQLAGPSSHPDTTAQSFSQITQPEHTHIHPHSHTQNSLQSQSQNPLQTQAQNTQDQHEPCPSSAPHTHECRWKGCGATFESCDALTTHIGEVHIGSGKARYECFWEDCVRNGDAGFQSKQKISRHVQSHTGHRPFQCLICHQNFSEAATLQQHMRRHTQEKPYVCDHPGCGKSFAITGALTIHKRTHNGEKPFKCSYCDRGFAESSNLSKHLRTHTGARPYVCGEPGCGKAFARPDQLNRHKSVHKKQARGIGGRSMIEA